MNRTKALIYDLVVRLNELLKNDKYLIFDEYYQQIFCEKVEYTNETIWFHSKAMSIKTLKEQKIVHKYLSNLMFVKKADFVKIIKYDKKRT